MKRETAVLRYRLSDKVAVACSSAFTQDINPVIGTTRFLFSIFDRLVIRKKEKAVSNCRLSVKVAITYSSAFAQDINPVIGMTRFPFSIFNP